jgi:hypothetical protein
MAELDNILSNFDENDWIVTSSSATHCFVDPPDGKLRINCGPTAHLLYDDPIVHPGQPGASHLHHFFGNTLTDCNSTYESLRTTGDGTCSGGPLNRTGYWHPAMIKPAGPGFPVAKVVKPSNYTVYYIVHSQDIVDFTSPQGSPHGLQHAAQRFPRGFSHIAGWKDADGATPYGVWFCEDHPTFPATGKTGGFHGTIADAIADGGCAAGSSLVARITFPNCWDGVNITSANGRNHVVYQSQDSFGHNCCPLTHPYVIPALLLQVLWDHQGPDDIATWYLSSDRHDGATWDGGHTFHTDWFGAWSQDIVDIWSHTIQNLAAYGPGGTTTTCNNGNLNNNNTGLKESGPGVTIGGRLPEASRYLDVPAEPVIGSKRARRGRLRF